MSYTYSISSSTSAGTQIQVYGVVKPVVDGKAYVPVRSTYTIDDKVVGTFTAPNLTEEADGILFFNSGQIPVHLHTLTVTVESASEDYPFLFDYLLFTPAPTVASDALPSSTSSNSASSSSTSSPLAGTALSFSATPSSTSDSSASSSATSSTSSTIPINTVAEHSSNHAGPIAGGVIGGVVFFAAVLGLAWWWTQRKRASSNLDPRGFDGAPLAPLRFGHIIDTTAYLCPDKVMSAAGGAGGVSGVTPYLLPRDYNSSSANVIPRETAAPLAPGSVLGRPDTSTRPHKAPLPNVASPSSSTNFFSSQQQLINNEISSGSGGSGTAFAQEQQGGRGDGSDSSTRARLPKSSSQSPVQAPHPLSAVHADSGLRFPRDTDPDEVLSQMTRGTQLPAYSPYMSS